MNVQKCFRCGATHRATLNTCPTCGGVTDLQLDALCDFVEANGPHWKSKLRLIWECGPTDYDSYPAELQQLRNECGPSWLTSFPGYKQFPPAWRTWRQGIAPVLEALYRGDHVDPYRVFGSQSEQGGAR